jgi:linoleate 10R-lipoxygenase
MGQVSNYIMQFNCLYRWHATTSEEDEKWVGKLTSKSFPGKKSDQV